MKFFLFIFVTLGSLTLGQVLQANYEPLAGSVALELDLLGKTNAARAEHGLPPLQADETLALAARHHALEMATLNYFSHQSPTPGVSTPPERIAKAGSPYIAVGENIAKMPPMLVINLAERTVTGWMNSPGHRANVLESRFTHVGFGIAKDSQGFSYVVQNFAYEPFKLLGAEVKSKSRASYLVVLDVTLPQPSTAAFSYGNETTQPMQLEAGSNQVEFSTSEANQLYIQGAVPAPEGGGYIFQDGGWLTLASGRYQADELTPKTYLQITDAKARIRSSSLTEVTLTLDGVAEKSLAVFVNDSYEPNAVVSPGVVRLELPENAEPTTIALGEVSSGNQVNISMAFRLETNGNEIVLVASSPETLH
jgi:uncharacterized protein YkwD